MRHWLLIGVARGWLRERGRDLPRRAVRGSRPIHVHGLGLDQQTQTLYIATHTGLWAAEVRRSDASHRSLQDTMGFTLVRPGLFLGAGHPDLREAKPGVPPLLGLIESSDNGRTWQQLSLLGKGDFTFSATPVRASTATTQHTTG